MPLKQNNLYYHIIVDVASSLVNKFYYFALHYNAVKPLI